jgi:hypothetical protein
MKQTSPHMRFGVGHYEPVWAAIACCTTGVNRILSARLSLVDATRINKSRALKLDSETFMYRRCRSKQGQAVVV